MIARLLDRWPQKVGALVLATVVWFFVSTSEVTTTQRSLLVPLSVEGVGERRVAVGLPEFVEVTVTGPSNRVDRLRPENIEAVLDLGGLQGEFDQTIDVRPPQGIDLVRVNPEQVIGFIEQVSSKQVPVSVVWLQEPPPDMQALAVPQPSSISVSARDEILERVVRAVAPVRTTSGTTEVQVYAADAAGLPVRDVTLSPATVAVATNEREIFVRRDVRVELETPSSDRIGMASLASDEASVVGPPSTIRDLASVVARVEPETVPQEPGRYTLTVRLQLPPDVVAVRAPSANVTVIDPAVAR